MKKTILYILVIFFISSGCSGIKRVDTKEVIDISGKWNDTDSRLVSEEMIGDVISRAWLNKFKETHKGTPPVVIIGTVRNMSHEHINVQTFTKDLERALINSGEVEFVASDSERSEIREERRDQASHASEKSAKSEGKEAGADFMLQGSINTIVDKAEGEAVLFYQVNLELVEIESHKKVWMGDKKIKKYIKKSNLSF